MVETPSDLIKFPIRNVLIRRQAEGNETCSPLELQAGIERWESYVSRYEKKLKDKMDDEIKRAGLESLVLEELEKHLIINSNRLRTFEDARLEIVTYVEAKFGLRIRDSKPSDTGLREHSDPTDVGTVNSLSRQSKEKGQEVRAMGILSAVEHIFNETAMQARTLASNRLAKAVRASHGPRVSPQTQSSERMMRTVEKSKAKSEGTKGAILGSKGSGNGETSKNGYLRS